VFHVLSTACVLMHVIMVVTGQHGQRKVH